MDRPRPPSHPYAADPVSKSDRDLVMLAVQQWGSALQHASDTLKVSLVALRCARDTYPSAPTVNFPA